jgi:hypothetical protein
MIKDLMQIFCKKRIDRKVETLRKLTCNFLFIEYYTHTGCDMYKIKNEWTRYSEDKLVLCPVSEGIEKALDLAIIAVKKWEAQAN